MPSDPSDMSAPVASEGEGGVQWTVSPAREKPGLALLVVGFLLLVGLLVAAIAGDWIWGALSVLLLFATVSRFYLPSRLTLSQTGVRADFPLRTRRAAWSEIAWIRHDELGALIRLRRQKLLRSSEFTILFGRDRERAIAALRAHAPEGLVEDRGLAKELLP
jgi:hypothetical protein